MLDRDEAFHHEAFFYASDDQYAARTAAFVQQGLELDEPVMVAVPRHQLELLRKELGRVPTDLVRMEAMEDLGRNPAWIIPAWQDFAQGHVAEGKRARGIGEPIWATRTDDELIECGRHEALINIAFEKAVGFALLCPYDLTSLSPEILRESRHNHPIVSTVRGSAPSADYRNGVPKWLDSALPPIPNAAESLEFGLGSLRTIRELASTHATAAGLSELRVSDVLVAVSEAVTNSLRHGGGSGSISFWQSGDRFICEVRDRGIIDDPLAGRVMPSREDTNGRGLWLINQLCDLVQVRVRDGVQQVRMQLVV